MRDSLLRFLSKEDGREVGEDGRRCWGGVERGICRFDADFRGGIVLHMDEKQEQKTAGSSARYRGSGGGNGGYCNYKGHRGRLDEKENGGAMVEQVQSRSYCG